MALYDNMMEDYFQNVHQLQYPQVDGTLACSESMPTLSFDQQQTLDFDQAGHWLFAESWLVDVDGDSYSPSSEGTASVAEQQYQLPASSTSMKTPEPTSEQEKKVGARKAVSPPTSLNCLLESFLSDVCSAQRRRDQNRHAQRAFRLRQEEQMHDLRIALAQWKGKHESLIDTSNKFQEQIKILGARRDSLTQELRSLQREQSM